MFFIEIERGFISQYISPIGNALPLELIERRQLHAELSHLHYLCQWNRTSFIVVKHIYFASILSFNIFDSHRNKVFHQMVKKYFFHFNS